MDAADVDKPDFDIVLVWFAPGGFSRIFASPGKSGQGHSGGQHDTQQFFHFFPPLKSN
jgi:hypothetical protein